MKKLEINLDDLLANLNGSNTLPDPDLLLFWKMNNERKMWIDMEVDATAISYLRMIHIWNAEDVGIPAEERKPIRIYIMNYGGDGDMMWMLLDAIAASQTPVYTINCGVAASAASVIFIAGHKRFMMPNAKVLIHEGYAEMKGDAVKVLDHTDSYRKELKKLKEYILSRTKIPPSTMNKKRNNDWELSSAECLKYGVCDKVVQSLDEIV